MPPYTEYWDNLREIVDSLKDEDGNSGDREPRISIEPKSGPGIVLDLQENDTIKPNSGTQNTQV